MGPMQSIESGVNSTHVEKAVFGYGNKEFDGYGNKLLAERGKLDDDNVVVHGCDNGAALNDSG
eukprot:3135873-Karenia_brevis.AAC.1